MQPCREDELERSLDGQLNIDDRGRKEQRGRTSDISSMFSLSIWPHNVYILECLAMDFVLCLQGEIANLL